LGMPVLKPLLAPDRICSNKKDRAFELRMRRGMTAG
jgi:hypothetical protein